MYCVESTQHVVHVCAVTTPRRCIYYCSVLYKQNAAHKSTLPIKSHSIITQKTRECQYLHVLGPSRRNAGRWLQFNRLHSDNSIRGATCGDIFAGIDAADVLLTAVIDAYSLAIGARSRPGSAPIILSGLFTNSEISWRLVRSTAVRGVISKRQLLRAFQFEPGEHWHGGRGS